MFNNIYTKDLHLAIFDIESTGLNPDKDIIISASFCDEDGQGLRQYFCQDPQSEFLLIGKIIEEFSMLDGIITYNGKRFDIPFIITRAKKYGIDTSVFEINNIDVYRLLKKYWKAGSLMPSLSQSAVELAMGLNTEREDEINGAECIPLYNHFLVSGSEIDKEKILLHNTDDVRQLSKIANKLSFLPFHQIAFEQGYTIIKRDSFPGAEDIKINVLENSFQMNKIVCLCNTISGLSPMDAEEEYYHLVYDAFSGAIRLELFTKEIENFTYIDLTKMPVNINDYINLEGFSSNYLILMEDNKPFYKEINLIIMDLLRKV